VADHRQGEAVADPLRRELLVGVDGRGLLVGEIAEAHGVALRVVQRDEEVLRVHQLADHRMHAAQHLGHLQLAAGQVGDLVQRALQARGLVQVLDRPALVGQLHRAGEARRHQRAELAPVPRRRLGHALGLRPIGDQHHRSVSAARAQHVGDLPPARLSALGDRCLGSGQRRLHHRRFGPAQRRGRPVAARARLPGGGGHAPDQPHRAAAEPLLRLARHQCGDLAERPGREQRRHEVRLRLRAGTGTVLAALAHILDAPGHRRRPV